MGVKDSFLARYSIVRELLLFLWHKKLWWLIPIVLMLIILGLFMILGGSSGIAPFIYSLF